MTRHGYADTCFPSDLVSLNIRWWLAKKFWKRKPLLVVSLRLSHDAAVAYDVRHNLDTSASFSSHGTLGNYPDVRRVRCFALLPRFCRFPGT
jgi:hypothetical protein